MEKMNDLRDLLKHEVQDLMSAEQQIIDALPKMIEKASNPTLKKGLQEHLHVTEIQHKRCEQVLTLMSASNNAEQQPGLLSKLFGGGEKMCKGMQGLIKEGQKILAADIDPKVMDAAIIASAQKIEHYEICGYGTVRAYARQLNLPEVARLLEETLNEEYDADDLLTSLAYAGLNGEADKRRSKNGSPSSHSKSKSASNGNGHSTARQNGKAASSSRNKTRSSAKKTSSGKTVKGR